MKKNILICDDDQDIVDLMTLIFEKEGHNVISINNCNIIWNEIEKQRPDVIFMDLWIPDMGGEEATKILKRENDTKSIRVILLSASTQIAEVAKRTKADGYLPKPFDIKELKDLLN